MFPELKKGIQSGAGAVVADELVKLVHNYYGKYFPSSWIRSKMAMDVEPFVIPVVIYFTSLCMGNLPLVEKLSMFAVREKVHDLTKSLWVNFKGMFKELYEVSKEK